MQSLDPHQRPPDGIRNVYKKYQKMKRGDLDCDPDIVDLAKDLTEAQTSKVVLVDQWDPARVTTAFQSFARCDVAHGDLATAIPVYEHHDMPGLHIIPSLLSPEIQILLLSRLLHRDLAEPSHLTNIHTHYKISYPPSGSTLFSLSPHSSEIVAQPLDPTVHRPLTATQLLSKKIRWVTLGGQYDWTQKRYPDSLPPAFPADIKKLLEDLFTDTKAEAAIVNLYSPGDTLSVHRDVAESSTTGLVSISLGCDAVFVIGTSCFGHESSAFTENGDLKEKTLALRLRSGSAVYMSGESRFAWHGVPQIIAGTCPDYLEDWPDDGNEAGEAFDTWKGWMAGKRVNLNVRQMHD